MRIFGFMEARSRRASKQRKKAASKLEKITDNALLDAAVRDPEVVAALVDKYGKIWVPDKTDIDNAIQNIGDIILKEVEKVIRNSSNQELDSHINELIDRVIYGGARYSRRQYEKISSGSANRSGENSTTDIIQQHRKMERGPKYSSGSSASLKALEIIIALARLAGKQVKSDSRESNEIIYAVEQNGEFIEMSEQEYQNYSHQKRRPVKEEM